MTLDALAFDMRSAHHLAATAKAHGNVAAWRKWTRIEHAIRGLIASGRTDLGGGSHSPGLPTPAGDLGATTAGAASPPPTLRPRPALSASPWAVQDGQGLPPAGATTTNESDARTGCHRWGV